MNLMHPILRSIIESAPAYRMPAAEDRFFLLGRTLHPEGRLERLWRESSWVEQLLYPKAYYPVGPKL